MARASEGAGSHGHGARGSEPLRQRPWSKWSWRQSGGAGGVGIRNIYTQIGFINSKSGAIIFL